MLGLVKSGKLEDKMAKSVHMDEYELMNDPKYRNFVQQVEKALKAFEYTSEWADLVSALGKLNKVLQNNTKYQVIPRKFLVGQRLAQCMHPALPSGVHLKALETYDLIFRNIGSERLVQELSIYSNGLFPLLSHAAINVKPSLLEVYETHFIPLGEHLRPALDGFLIAALPGLEEGSDFHEKTNTLLKQVCDGVGKEYFYGSLWRCVLNNSTVRLPAVSFIILHFLKKKSLEDQLYVMGTNIETLVNGVCACLLDPNVLVQRTILDLLLCCFPLHDCQVLGSNIASIATAAVTVLLRRDISLSRRLLSWIFGTDSGSTAFSSTNVKKSVLPSGSTQSSRHRKKRENYFDAHSKKILIQAFTLCLSNPSRLVPIPNSWSSLGDLWPYRLLICLLDHNELSGPLLDVLSLEIFRALYLDTRKNASQDVKRTRNILLNNMGIGYTWQRLSDLLTEACLDIPATNKDKDPKISATKDDVNMVGSGKATVGEICSLMNFMVDITSVDNYPEAAAVHLPSSLNHVLQCCVTYVEKLNVHEFNLSLQLASKIISKIQPVSQPDSKVTPNINKSNLPDIKEETESLSSIKVNDYQVTSPQVNTNHTVKLISTIEEFFFILVNKRVVKNSDCLDRCYNHLLTNPPENNAPALVIEENAIPVYINLCQLMIKVSLLHKTVIDSAASTPAQPDKNICSPTRVLKKWIQNQLVLACFTSDSAVSVSYASLSGFLDLVLILKSQLYDFPLPPWLGNVTPSSSPILDFNASATKPPQGLCVESMMTMGDLNYVCCRTTFFTKCTQLLWDNLAEEKGYLHLETATLLQQVHNLAEDASLCEGVICSAMASNDESVSYEARKRFCTLYNITRDLKQKLSSSTNFREFDRPLFFLLDSLTHKLDAHNAQAVDWLYQCLKYGDIARILEPLLFILLHPDTNRVSVQHVNIHQPESVETKNDDTDKSINTLESKIYAISSSGGNVMYHVNPDGKKRFNAPSAPKVLALTSQNSESNSKSTNDKWVTTKFNLPEYEAPFNYEPSTGKYLSINMFFNPFGSLSSLTSEALESIDASMTFTPSHPDLSNVRRFDTRKLKPADEVRRTPTPGATPIPTPAHTPVPTPSSTPVPSRLSKISLDENELQPDSKVIANLLDDIVEYVAERLDDPEEAETSSSSSCETTRQTISESISFSSWMKPISVNQLHSHVLLYTQVYDSRRTLYALTTLWNVILCDPQRVLFNMATTSISNRLGVRSQELQQLCARHRKALLGRSFYGDLDVESATAFRSSSFLEVIVTTCLYYIRSYYPSLPQSRLNEDEIHGNQKVRILACEILRLVFCELVTSIKGRPTFSTYMHDMLMRCKVQKMVLHCIVSSVYNFQFKNGENTSNAEDLFSDTIVEFNEKTDSGGFQEDMQKSLLKLLEQLMILEHKSSPTSSQNEIPTHNRKDSDSRAARIRFQPQMSSLKYIPNILIPSQSMFLSAIQTALQQTHKAHLHTNWLTLVEAALPFAGRSLTRLVVCVISQLCHNLESVAENISNCRNGITSSHMPPNYLIIILRSLATLCHYCLLDTSNTVSTPPLSPQPQPPNSNSTNSQSMSGPLQVISNFLHVFSSVEGLSEASTNRESGNPGGGDPLVSTRRTVLSHLPRILAAVLSIWKSISIEQCDKSSSAWEVMGSVKDVKQNILSFLSPISLLHSANFMGAIAVVWYDLRDTKPTTDTRRSVIPPVSPDQSILVDLIAAIRVLPMESVLQTVRQVMKQPPQTTHARKKRVPLEVNMLQFFLAYIRVFPGQQLLEGWKSLLSLLRDGLNISSSQPLAQFHLLAILHEFVQAAPLIEDRKDQKDLQDVAQKLVDACTTVAGARLAQRNWLRRNFEVKPGPQHDEMDDDIETELKETSSLKLESTTKEVGDETPELLLGKYSVQALLALAEFVAPVLDVVYVSEEKEKVVPLVSNIMNYVTPYLRNHSKNNAPSFRACSNLLASISGYQYSRKAWRKDAFELLVDPQFFQMECACLPHWKTIVDHLMTHDKTSFRDFLGRMSVAQTGSLKLFSSKDQENEQKAQLTKRLAFIIFCSEKDQYQRFLPEIQEKLIEAMRVANYPVVQAHILLCFRVLILRMSATHLTSLWPFIYTELCQVFLQIEMELLADTPEFKKNNNVQAHRMANLESLWVNSQSNGLATSNTSGWLQLYLQACKLLDLVLTLPADLLPQFQMYQWAFIGNRSSLQSPSWLSSESSSPPSQSVQESDRNSTEMPRTASTGQSACFEPHVPRIEKFMRTKNPNPEYLMRKPKSLLLKATSIKTLMDLHPFFYTLVKANEECKGVVNGCHQGQETASTLNDNTANEESVDDIVDLDFLEPIPL